VTLEQALCEERAALNAVKNKEAVERLSKHPVPHSFKPWIRNKSTPPDFRVLSQSCQSVIHCFGETSR
jgi:hypothetical protein